MVSGEERRESLEGFCKKSKFNSGHGSRWGAIKDKDIRIAERATWELANEEILYISNVVKKGITRMMPKKIKKGEKGPTQIQIGVAFHLV